MPKIARGCIFEVCSWTSQGVLEISVCIAFCWLSHDLGILLLLGIRGIQSCLEVAEACVRDTVCNAQLALYLKACSANGNLCDVKHCQAAIRFFYQNMPFNVAQMLAFCDCAPSDIPCQQSKEALHSKPCALNRVPAPTCLDVIRSCQNDELCRWVKARIPDFLILAPYLLQSSPNTWSHYISSHHHPTWCKQSQTIHSFDSLVHVSYPFRNSNAEHVTGVKKISMSGFGSHEIAWLKLHIQVRLMNCFNRPGLYVSFIICLSCDDYQGCWTSQNFDKRILRTSK